MKSFRLAAPAVVLALPTLIAWPAHAQGSTNAVCTVVFTAHFSPGFTLTPSSGPDESGGETGSIACAGTIDGGRVAGPGTFGIEGVYTATCLFDHGSGRYFGTVPTDAGSRHFVGDYRYSRIGGSLFVDLSQAGAHGSGILAVVPTQGDCIRAPVTQGLATGTATLSG
jgi:hypothetical protein